MLKRLTTKEFIEKAKVVHGSKYDYSKVEYVGSQIKVIIICYKHGEFEQQPNNHLYGKGCITCGFEKLANSKIATFRKTFIERANKVHHNKYDYSKFVYEHNHAWGTIICPIHGEFKKTAKEHLRGQGCILCSKAKELKRQSKPLQQFIDDANKIHNNKYDYSLVEYKSNKSMIKIICPIHGEFIQQAWSHLAGRGCLGCARKRKESKACSIITEWLNKNNIKYEKEKRFETCKDKRRLPFDFYLIDKNILIEYNGKQHYEKATGYYYDTLEKIQKHDLIKQSWAFAYNILLIIIKYNEYNDKEELENLLEEKIQAPVV